MENYDAALKDLSKATALDATNGLYFRILGNTKYQVSELNDNPCLEWEKAIELGDTKAAFSIKRFCR